MYSPEEFADFHLCYGYTNCIAMAAREKYLNKISNRRLHDAGKKKKC